MNAFTAALYGAGAFLALTSVLADAFAAHGLAAVAPAMEQAVVWFKEGANFQMNHALALLIAAAVADRLPGGPARAALRSAAVFFGVGALLFSGSLYSISFAGPGFFAPWGGFTVMIGWGLFALGAAAAAIGAARR